MRAMKICLPSQFLSKDTEERMSCKWESRWQMTAYQLGNSEYTYLFHPLVCLWLQFAEAFDGAGEWVLTCVLLAKTSHHGSILHESCLNPDCAHNHMGFLHNQPRPQTYKIPSRWTFLTGSHASGSILYQILYRSMILLPTNYEPLVIGQIYSWPNFSWLEWGSGWICAAEDWCVCVVCSLSGCLHAIWYIFKVKSFSHIWGFAVKQRYQKYFFDWVSAHQNGERVFASFVHSPHPFVLWLVTF
jgi:hypothetical protein